MVIYTYVAVCLFSLHLRLGDGSSQPSAVVAGKQPEKPNMIVIWRNGFTVNDGPLREFDSPGATEFMQSIRNGGIPMVRQ